jgi:ring-1,2-phenylacetyl-CoA epoxidase subunit PaaC
MDDVVEYCLRLADDRLVLGHRLSEWCGHAPILEEEMALGNLALDLLDQANLVLGMAGDREARGRSADDLAFFRDVTAFRNCLLVEQPNGDFAKTIARQFLFDVFDLHLAAGLESSSEAPLAAFGARAGKEAAYHLRHSREWMIRLGDGTEESHRRLQAAMDELWPFTEELFEEDALTQRLATARIAVAPAALRAPWREQIDATLREATVTSPAQSFQRSGGRRGFHGEALGRMLSEMQSLARAFAGATW